MSEAVIPELAVNSDAAPETGEAGGKPQRTDPLSFAVKALMLLPQLAIPLAFAFFSITRESGLDGFGGITLILLLIAAAIAFNLASHGCNGGGSLTVLGQQISGLRAGYCPAAPVRSLMSGSRM